MNTESPRVAVIGAGMSGICAGIRLQEAGHEFVIYEKAESIGGTWRDNRYPGVACDVPSHVYSYSFAPNPEWSTLFAPGPEILDYFERCASDHGLDGHIHTGMEVTSCEWHDGRWHLAFSNGRTDVADYVIMATGVLHHPNIPHFEGLDTFAGPVFHTARWDPSAPIEHHDVGIIGTGSTAIQVVAEITASTRSLTMFQRTPQWIMPADNTAYSDDDIQRWRTDPEAQTAHRDELNSLVKEVFADAVIDKDGPSIKAMQDLCRDHLEGKVTDPELRERLRPDYLAGCKRIVMSGGFYDAIQLPQARLVTDPIERIEPTGVRTTDGELHELDTLVLATGFKAHDFMRPMGIVGRDGLTLEEAWSPAPRAYRSTCMPGFPNLFMVVGPHCPVGNFSLIEVAELQVSYILQLIDHAQDRSGTVEPSPNATDEFNDALRAAVHDTIWVTGCESWYIDEDGTPAVWPWSVNRFIEEMSTPEWDDFLDGPVTVVDG